MPEVSSAPTPAAASPVAAPKAEPQRARALDGGATPEDLVSAQGFQGNGAVLSYLASAGAPPPGDAGTRQTTWRNGVECPSCHPGKHETQVDPTKDAAYDALIATLHGLQGSVVSSLRESASTLDEPARGIALDLIEAFESLVDELIWVVLFEVGVAVGFVEGLVGMVQGIVALVRWLLEGFGSTLYAVIDGGAWQQEWAVNSAAALWALVDGLPFVVMDWFERVRAAPTDRRAAMVGELVGQVLAAVATTKGLAAAAPKVSLRTAGAAGTASAIPGFSATEAAIIREAEVILASPEFAAVRRAHVAGESVTVKVGGRMIQYEPGLPASGMTMFGEDGFLIGREAFSSTGELNKTVLHELHRLATSQSAAGVSAEVAAQETQAAFKFAERAATRMGN